MLHMHMLHYIASSKCTHALQVYCVLRSVYCLASPDTLEVMFVTDWLTEWLTESLRVSTDLTDVTLVSDDTYRRFDWCDEDDEGDEGDEDDEDDEDDEVDEEWRWWICVSKT